jgi:hypothetical protein
VFLLAYNCDETRDELELNHDSFNDNEFELGFHAENDDDETWIGECNIENDDLVIPDD